ADHWFNAGLWDKETCYSFDSSPGLPSILKDGSCDSFFSYDIRRVDQAFTPFKHVTTVVGIIDLCRDLKFVHCDADHLASLTNLQGSGLTTRSARYWHGIRNAWLCKGSKLC